MRRSSSQADADLEAADVDGGLGPRLSKARQPAGQTMVTQAHDHLVRALMTLQIPPGERIAIDQVARRLNISQTPVREALSQLEAKKLVVKTPNVGYRASPQMTREEVRDLYDLRLLIEPRTAARAAAAMSKESVAVLLEIDAAMSSITDSNPAGYSIYAEADDRLHKVIATLSGNRLVADLLEGLHAHMQIFRALYKTNAPTEAAREHRLIIDALVDGNPVAAERAMRSHLDQAYSRMDDALAHASSAVAHGPG